MSKQLFCDLDGVMVDFVGPSLRIHGRHDLVNDPHFPARYDYWPDMGLGGNEFWSAIREAGQDWWLSLPNYPWADEMLAMLREADPTWSIATKPCDAGACYAKWEWRNRHADGHRLHITTDKVELAAPGRVLIDDYERNVDQWVRAGGEAILFPRPWNRLAGGNNPVDPIAYVNRKLRELGFPVSPNRELNRSA